VWKLGVEDTEKSVDILGDDLAGETSSRSSRLAGSNRGPEDVAAWRPESRGATSSGYPASSRRQWSATLLFFQPLGFAVAAPGRGPQRLAFRAGPAIGAL